MTKNHRIYFELSGAIGSLFLCALIHHTVRRMIILAGISLPIILMAMTNNSLASDLHANTHRDDLAQSDVERVKNITQPTRQFSSPEAFEKMSAGAGTSLKHINRDSFSHPSANITFAEQSDFSLGNGLFRKLWTSSPSSTQASDGLGPLYNARGCQSCHLKDGRGRPPEKGEVATSLFLRLARRPINDTEKQAIANFDVVNFPDSTYGGQLQNVAVPGLSAEGQLKIEYSSLPVKLSDGTTITLRKPSYSIDNLAYGPLDLGTSISPRVTPQMIGMGLIQAIHPADILSNAQAKKPRQIGISGKAAIVRDAKSSKLVLGRFGWKAQNPTIRAQSAGAFSGDIGISNPDAPSNYGDCTNNQPECLAMPTGEQTRLGETEAPDPVLDLVTFYSENLAVPQRRNVDDKNVLAGKEIFYNLGCISCHRPKYVTSRNATNKAHRFQLIWPYSDFLLHDMGKDLADGQQVGVATGNEWRTPPLWGIGLTKIVSGHTFFLHDGRARNLTEAILWHGGEAQDTKQRFSTLSKNERNKLIKFLESL